MAIDDAGMSHSLDNIKAVILDKAVGGVISTVSISLFGALEVRVGTTECPVVSRKLQALVAYLCFRKDFSETRERLAGLLWSESDEDKARASLRQTIGDLRSLFGNQAELLVFSPKLKVGLNSALVSSDIDAVMEAAEKGYAHPILLRIENPVENLLLELEYIDPEFRIWLIAKRRAYSDRLVHLLEKTLVDADVAKDVIAINAQAILALDGSHEIATRFLMRHYSKIGAEARALKVYGDLWNLLDEQYDAEPSPETQRLVVEIKRGQLVPPSPELFNTNAKPKAIGLFLATIDVQGIKPEAAFRLQAFRQQLATNLVRFREWLVFDEADRTDSSQNQSDPTRYFKIQFLPVVVGEKLRVSVHLKDATTGLFLWSETVNLFEQGWIEAHFKTIRRIATTLNVHVSSARLHRISEANTAPPEIYDRWLRAQSAMMAFNGAQWDAMAQILGEIVSAAPHFSPGFRTLTNLENSRHIVSPGVRRSHERHLHAIELARRAVELDPVDSRAHLCLSWSYALAAQSADAVHHANTAIELNDSDPWTLVSAGNILGFCGEIESAVTAADHALFISPMQSRAQLAYDASIRFMARDYSACLDSLKKSGAGYPGALAWRVAALVQTNQLGEAKLTLAKTLDEIEAAWLGTEEPSQTGAYTWFKEQFPILDPTVKDHVLGSLDKAYNELPETRY